MRSKVLASPSKYIQGAGELGRIRDRISWLEGPFLFILGGFAYENLRTQITGSFAGTESLLIIEKFNGECSHSEINRLRDIYQRHKCRVTVGVGGGKALDTAKGVAYYEKTPVITVPTIASTDSPTSAISVVYTDGHVFQENLLMSRNPELVLVDTDIIMHAPVRFLVAGMGDALSTYFEAMANVSSKHQNFAGGIFTNTSVAMAKLCYEILMRDGLKAKRSAEMKVLSQELENVIEANILLSGVGFESNGLACAHSIYNSLTILPQCHHLYHGELVAFGTIVQLILEQSPESEVAGIIEFCLSVGLPVTVSDLSEKELSGEEIMRVAESACRPGTFMESEPFSVTPDMVYQAICKADAFGKECKNRK
jgi:glycerol dehydrogenase